MWVEFRVLGELEASGESPIELGAYRQRALLAMLLIHTRSVVATDRLIDELWGDAAGTNPQNSLWVHVSGLRKALEPDREKRSEGSFVLTRSQGYYLDVDPVDIDAFRFEQLVAEGRALIDTDPSAASLVLGEALALWRGRAYEDFSYEQFAQAEIGRLEELRLEAVETRIEADLRRGMAAELVSELEGIVRQHPLRERVISLLMLALYRAGRQADALAVYRDHKARLAEQLGLEPSAALQSLEHQIVVADSALDTTARSSSGSGPQSGLTVRGYELRDKIGEGASGVAYLAYQPAVGREVAVKVIRPELANDPAFIRRFEAEAQLVARLEHPHIVPLYDYWREPDAAFLVMRMVKSGSLADVLEQRALTSAEAVRVAGQVGGALHAAHGHGVVHRDVTPANVLIDHVGNAYLADFGIAASLDTIGPSALQHDTSRSADYVSPEQTASGEITPAADVYSLAVVMAQALTGLGGDVAQIRGALPSEVMRVIDRATRAQPAERYADVPAFVRELTDALGTDGVMPAVPTEAIENPYKGLRSFDRADAADFHGRSRTVDRLLSRLGEPGVRGRFVALVGASGSGKSSVVRAGLLPAITAGALPGSDDWFAVTMIPAPHPFEELEAALLRIAVDPPQSLLGLLAGSEPGLHRAVDRILPDDGSQLVLVIDQFEELFTQVDQTTADRFLDALVAAVSDPHGRIRVVLTLRADFYDRPLRHRGTGELLRDATEVITPMTPEELEQAIVEPAAKLGVTFEPNVVAQLVRDVADRATALPLLQYALTELFEARAGFTIGADAYQSVGGVAGALVSRADGLLAELGAGGTEVARQVLLRLVTLGEGADDTRRRVLLTELQNLEGNPSDVAAVLNTFGRHRLLGFDRDPVSRSPTVEIAHEALLSEWGRLRSWIDEARDDVRNQRRLALAMGEWAGSGHDDDYLLRGGQLAQLDAWSQSAGLPLSSAERRYLDASIEDAAKIEAEREEQQFKLEDAERRARQRVQQLAALAMTVLVVGALAVYAFAQQRSAAAASEERDQLVAAASLADTSVESLDTDPDLALALAVEAVRVTADLGFATQDAIDAVHWALYAKRVQFDVDDTVPVAVRPGPNGLTGVWVIAPAELVSFAESVSGRRLTDEQCREFGGQPCATETAVPLDLPIFGGDEAYGSQPMSALALDGTHVDWFGLDSRDLPLLAELRSFTSTTGIEVAFAGEDVFLALEEIQQGMEDTELNVDFISLFDREIPLLDPSTALDLTAYLDAEQLRSDFTPYLISQGSTEADGSWPSVDGRIHGVPLDLDVKGLVYYVPKAMEAAGYELPETLDELLELSREMVADGRTPWCFGFDSPGEAADGWPGTDLFEALTIRLAGPEVYDDWAQHRVPFDHPAVQAAGQYFETLLLEPGFALNGPTSVSTTEFGTSLGSLLRRDEDGEPDPECWFYSQADFVLNSAPPDIEFGEDLGVFVLPPAVAGEPVAMTGQTTYLVPFSDRPEVRALLAAVADPAFGENRAALGNVGRYLSPNTRFDSSIYLRDQGEPRSEAERELRATLARTAQEAVVAGRFRLDASDSMPPAIGSTADGVAPGPFWQAMLDVPNGTKTMRDALSDVEAAWVALESGGS